MNFYDDVFKKVNGEWENKVPLDGYEHVNVQFVNRKVEEKPELYPNANYIVRSQSNRMVIGGYALLANGSTGLENRPVAATENGYPEMRDAYIYLVEHKAKVFVSNNRGLINPWDPGLNRKFNEERRPFDRFSATGGHQFTHDIRFNHVMAGRDMVLLNYTDEDLVVRDLDGFPRIYKPLEEEESHPLEGEIVLLESVFLDAPDEPGDTDTCYKHLAGMYSELAKTNQKYKVLEKSFIAANTVWSKRKKDLGDYAGVRITIATIIKPSEVKIIKTGAGVFLPDTGFVIQSRKIHSRYESPEFARKLNKLADSNKGSQYTFFINDPGNVFGPRYISFMGTAALVPMVHDCTSPEGFYYEEYGIDGVKRMKRLNSDELFATPFLRKSYEEAMYGGTIEEIEKRKLEKMKIRNEERKDEYERQKRSQDFLEANKKHFREDVRWYRSQIPEVRSETDDFLNALKSFASILAVTAGIVTTLYKLAN